MSLPTNRNLLKEYINPVYVETGIWRGDSIQQAIDAGYKEIHGLEIDKECIDFCKSRFDIHLPIYNPANPLLKIVKLYNTDSANGLWDVIKDIDQRMTFFLDSHWQMLEGTEPGHNPFPLLSEIEQISMHHIKDHTIIIDDMLIMQWDIVGYGAGLIKTRIEKINPVYKFTMHANPVINGIMVATVK